MNNHLMKEVEDLYKKYGAPLEGSGHINRHLNKGHLENKLNADFSNIYGYDKRNKINNIAFNEKA